MQKQYQKLLKKYKKSSKKKTSTSKTPESSKDAEGFIYAVAINGVTGKTGNYRDDLDKHLTNLKAIADIPVLTGFGVSTPADIERFNKVSDGVIVGTKIVRDLHEGKTDDVADFVKYGSNYQK